MLITYQIEFPIRLMDDLVEQLEIKTAAVASLKNRLNEVIKKNSNTFTKQMSAELKEII